MLFVLLACAKSPDTTATADTAPAPAPPTMLVSAYNSNAVHVIDLEAGAEVGRVEDIRGAQSIRTGPDGGLYVVAEKPGKLLRLDPDTLTAEVLLDGFSNPTAATFSGDGVLHVGEFSGDRVLRINGAERTVLADKLDGVDAGMVFGPAGLLWVPCFESSRIVAIDPQTGDAAHDWGGSTQPRSLWFDDDGQLWVTSWGSDALLRYDEDGTATQIAAVSRPSGLLADPDGESVWVVSDQDSRLTRLDRASGAVLQTLDAGALGVDGATFLAWRP